MRVGVERQRVDLELQAGERRLGRVGVDEEAATEPVRHVELNEGEDQRDADRRHRQHEPWRAHEPAHDEQLDDCTGRIAATMAMTKATR